MKLIRQTVISIGWLAVATAASPAQNEAGPAPTSPFTLSAVPRARLDQALAPLHARFDPAANMLREPFHTPGYHTTLKGGFVHGTRSALEYAVGLLDTGDEAWRTRAEAILRAVIALQDQDPASKTYGIWPWFLEEPLTVMSPPDWNWADFCGVQLLQVARDHRARLTPDVAALVDDAIKHAARSIQRRNVGPSYTNIAIMGTYVTLVASELYGWDDLHRYALDRLRRFYDYTKEQGSFTEYNSPTYTVVAVSELSRMRLHVQDKEALRLVEELYRTAWEEIAVHFHPPTRQWAGPHSRCYSTLLGRGTLAFLGHACAGRVDFGPDQPTIAEQRLPVPCPRDLEPFFVKLDAPRDVVKTYLKADPPVVGTTHLEPAFALGSVNRGDLWNQRRALVAYWGTPAKPAYLHLRVLRDDYDYADAQFFSVQRGGDVLAAINFGTDGGNTHVSLDRLKDGSVRARDLRLRFEFGGATGPLRLSAPAKLGDPARLALGDVHLSLVVPHAVFGDEPIHWETGGKASLAWLDLVIYQGPEREFRFREIEHAAIGLALRCGREDAPPPVVHARIRDGRLMQEWGELRLAIPVRPDKIGTLQKAVTY